jgi:hypothetical protein
MAENTENNSVNRVPSQLTEVIPGVTKKCRGKCSSIKPVDRFSKHKGNKDGLQDICKDCTSAFMHDYNERKSFERKQQLTAGDVQLDPSPVPLSSAGKVVKKELINAKVIPHQEKVTGGLGPVEYFKPDVRKNVKLPDSKKSEFSEMKAETKKMEEEIAQIHYSGVIFSEEEKAVIVGSLDRYIHIVEGIIEKLSK